MKENNITLVIDKTVLMGNKKFGITQQIIEILNNNLKSINF